MKQNEIEKDQLVNSFKFNKEKSHFDLVSAEITLKNENKELR